LHRYADGEEGEEGSSEKKSMMKPAAPTALLIPEGLPPALQAEFDMSKSRRVMFRAVGLLSLPGVRLLTWTHRLETCTHSRVSDWTHSRLSSIEPCFDCTITR
jgi:hypothetical protein